MIMRSPPAIIHFQLSTGDLVSIHYDPRVEHSIYRTLYAEYPELRYYSMSIESPNGDSEGNFGHNTLFRLTIHQPTLGTDIHYEGRSYEEHYTLKRYSLIVYDKLDGGDGIIFMMPFYLTSNHHIVAEKDVIVHTKGYSLDGEYTEETITVHPHARYYECFMDYLSTLMFPVPDSLYEFVVRSSNHAWLQLFSSSHSSSSSSSSSFSSSSSISPALDSFTFN